MVIKKNNTKIYKTQIKDPNTSSIHKLYLISHFKRLKRIRLTQIIIIVTFFLLWEFATFFDLLDSFVFSSPSRVVKTFISKALDGSIFYHMGITLAETFLSFAIVGTVAIATAILLWWNNSIAKILEPYLVVLNSLPKSALAPVFIVWLGNNMKTIIVCAVSVAVFASIITLYTAFNSVEKDKIKLIKTLGGTKKDVLFKIVIPSNIPVILSNMKVNIGASLVGVIIGEFLAANAGLGYLIIYGSQVFQLDLVIMSIVILCIIASGLYYLLSLLEKRYG
ncbi:MAG TPA: ABC transporter permease [Clostridiales bacterium]|nr:ABC transporter permease [Clostridiales bacterium]